MTAEDFPALKRTSDKASRRAQRQYLSFVGCSLLFLIAGALVSATVTARPNARTYGLIVAAALLGTSLCFTWAIKASAPERTWFAGRAVAESVKTISWRYMMRAEPFEQAVIAQTADKQYAEPVDPAIIAQAADGRFLDELETILKEKRSLAWNFGGSESDEPQITQKMREMRKSELGIRKEAYRSQRIADQRKWYSRKSEANRRNYQCLFWAVVSAQVAALIWAIVIGSHQEMKLNLTAVFSTVAAALVAWGQVKRYQELAQAYALATHELGIIEGKLHHISTEEGFSSFVADAENAISREHTMWAARRDV